MIEYEVTFENGWATVTINAHSSRAIRIAANNEDSEALARILNRIRRDHFTRDGAR